MKKQTISIINYIDHGIEGVFDGGATRYFADSLGNEAISSSLSNEIVFLQAFRIMHIRRKGPIEMNIYARISISNIVSQKT